jgi:hypothetical protein
MTRERPVFQVGPLFERFERRCLLYHLEQARLQERIAALTKRRDMMRAPWFLTDLVKPIGRALLPHLPGYTMAILGPFGLCAAVSIHFTRNGWSPKTHGEAYWQRLRSITFVPDQDRIAVRDRRRSTGTYAPGTLGDLNGMNFPRVPIPETADIPWFLQWLEEEDPV